MPDEEFSGWLTGNFVWNSLQPVLYFDNTGGMACIWRTDLIAQETVKIVPEHEAIEPRPIYLGKQEAVVYVDYESSELKIAFAPAVKSEEAAPKEQ